MTFSPPILGDARFLYCPLWDTRINDVFCYACQPLWDPGTGGLLPEEAFAGACDDPKRLLVLDLEVLRKAVSQAEEVADHYGILNVLVPIHGETLANPETADFYISACSDRVWPVVDCVHFEICMPPGQVSRDLLVRLVDKMKPFGCGVMLRVKPGFDRFDEIAAADIISVGMNLRATSHDEHRVISELERFGSEAGSRNLRCHVYGLKTVALGLAAASAGFDFVGSDAVTPPLERPASDEGVKPIDLIRCLHPRP